METRSPVKLTVSSRNGVADCLLGGDVGAVISVGQKLYDPIDVPYCFIAQDSLAGVTANEFAVTSDLVAEVWKADKRVVFHCTYGERRSPTAAIIFLTNFYGATQVTDIVHKVFNNCLSGKIAIDETVARSAILHVTDDNVRFALTPDELAMRQRHDAFTTKLKERYSL